jgi:ABC-type uncharacterized transport system substrate-binding protein
MLVWVGTIPLAKGGVIEASRIHQSTCWCWHSRIGDRSAGTTISSAADWLSQQSITGESAGVVDAFRQGLRETGFIEGQNLAIAFRWAEGRYDKLPGLASELPVTLLFAAGGPPSAFAAKGATSSIPVVFAVSDPVEIGLVPSLNHPSGNVTGMGIFNASLATKRVELMKELMPHVAVIGYLLNPADGKGAIERESVLAASRAFGIELRILNARTESELDSTFAGLEGLGVRALVVSGEPFFDSQLKEL